jgi:hypothetical protein
LAQAEMASDDSATAKTGNGARRRKGRNPIIVFTKIFEAARMYYV